MTNNTAIHDRCDHFRRIRDGRPHPSSSYLRFAEPPPSPTLRMCYSAESSAIAFAIASIGSTALYVLPHRHKALGRELRSLAVFFGFIGLMQLWDYLFWISGRSLLNERATKCAVVTNHLEPVVLALAMRALRGARLKKETRVLLFCYVAVGIPYTIQALRTVKYTVVTEWSRPGLDWEWNHLPYGTFFYLLFLLSFNVFMYQGLRTPRVKYLAMALNNGTFFFR